MVWLSKPKAHFVSAQGGLVRAVDSQVLRAQPSGGLQGAAGGGGLTGLGEGYSISARIGVYFRRQSFVTEASMRSGAQVVIRVSGCYKAKLI